MEKRFLSSSLNISTSLRHTPQAQGWSGGQGRFPRGLESRGSCSRHTVHRRTRQYTFCERCMQSFFFCKAHKSRTSLLLNHCTDAIPATGKKPNDHSTRSKRSFTFGELVLISRKTEPGNCDFYAAAAAAALLQSCPTLCDPIDSSPPGSTIPGILQARTLEWVAISFSNA